jgi:serine/threonine protein kinase
MVGIGEFRITRLAPGAVLGGKYRVARWIGEGSMGAVYEAATLDKGEQVALKIMHARLLADARMRHRFEREGELGTRIPSSAVVQVLESGFDEQRGAYFIAMEYVKGRPLDDWRSSSMSEAAAVRSVVEQLLRAVAAAHSVGVVHRDLKPANVMVVEDDIQERREPGAPRVKVLDFGVAKWLQSTTGGITQAGLGTPSWTAPEQGQSGHRPAPNADVWSLGLLVFWLLTGTQYWLAARDGGGLADLALELVRRPIAPASERAQALGVAELLPSSIDPWFARCVCRQPEERFVDAGAALDALGPILGLRARRSRWWNRWQRGLRRRGGGQIKR